jgi:hypothetical protein
MTHHLESNVQIGLNTRFGTMSARIMEFQIDIKKNYNIQQSIGSKAIKSK